MTNVRANADFSGLLATSIQDMKNSLGVLQGAMESAFESADQKQSVELFATLQYETSRIGSELFQMQVLQGLQTAQLVPQVDKQYVVELFEELLDNSYVLLQTRGLTVDVSCDPNLTWFFDRELIMGVMEVILVNCSRYSSQKISLSAEQDGAFLKLRILDDSRGYPDFLISSIPALDQQDSQNSSQLSMSIVQEIAMSHRRAGEYGSVSLSNVEQGGVFELLLP